MELSVKTADLPVRENGCLSGEALPCAPLNRVPLTGFLGGVLVSQIANNALHLAQPLLMTQLSGSMGLAAFFSSFDTAVHMGGTFLGGWPVDRWGARRLLIGTTLLRAAALALIPLGLTFGFLGLGWAMAAYTLDALIRGFTDTAVHTLPLELAEHDRIELDRLNSRYEFVFDLGAVAGPALLGASILWAKGIVCHLFIPVLFAAGSVLFVLVPAPPACASAPVSGRAGSLCGLRRIFSVPNLLLFGIGLALLNLFPLRKLLSAFFAKGILVQPAAAGWVGAAFGLGGVLGSAFYVWRGTRGSGAGWVAAGACGVLALAAGWLPGSLTPMLAAAFLFAFVNVGARLALTLRLQEETPLGMAGGVTAVIRFASNLASVVLKALVGTAFALGGGPHAAFAVVGVGLALLALAQFHLASRLRAAFRWERAGLGEHA